LKINNTEIYLCIYFSVHGPRIRALLNAQKTVFDDVNDESLEDEDESNDTDYRHQIVNSFLPSNGDYKIDNRTY